MKTGLSTAEILIAMTIAAILCAPQALASLTDNAHEDIYIMTTERANCCFTGVSYNSQDEKPAVLKHALYSTPNGRAPNIFSI